MSTEEMGESETVSSPESTAESPSSPPTNRTPSSSKKKSSKSSKPRLTAVQKNTNHKDAENKRRNAIRERFTELSHLVPDAEGQERSEQVMLAKTKTYLQDSIEELRKLEAIAAEQGIVVDEKDRLQDNDYGGRHWKASNVHKYEEAKIKKDGGKGGGGLADAVEDEDVD